MKQTALATVVAFTLAFVGGPFLQPVEAQGLQGLLGTSGISIPVTGAGTTGETFTGILDLQRFRVVDGAIAAVGTLTGTLTTATGQASIVRNVVMPLDLSTAQATCAVLHLELGPLSLNLLGLIVNLNQVILDIDADPAGGLLGSLLCAVAGLLNGSGPLGSITALLNRILMLL
jgi:hypothetical protein